MNVWSKQWPKEPGLYWFYGYRSRLTDIRPELYVITAHQRGAVIVIEGLFPIAVDGSFQRIITPQLPEETV